MHNVTISRAARKPANPKGIEHSENILRPIEHAKQPRPHDLRSCFLFVPPLCLHRFPLPFSAVSFNIAPRSKRGRIIRESRIPGYLETLQLFQRGIRDSIPENWLRKYHVRAPLRLPNIPSTFLLLFFFFSRCKVNWFWPDLNIRNDSIRRRGN